MKKVYNKLVRDNIPQIMKNNGAVPVTSILSDDEYLAELNKKLLEEVNEYLESGSVEELADVQEVFLGILCAKNISFEELEKIRMEKVAKRGAFKDKIFLKGEM